MTLGIRVLNMFLSMDIKMNNEYVFLFFLIYALLIRVVV